MSKASILIVEDEHIVLLDIQNTLENNGFSVAGHADRGEDAVKKAGELHPDLILMDIGLKGEMDGIEAAIQIRKMLDLPVIFLTAFGNPTTVERARLAEPFGYIFKPFEERELVGNIEMALYKHGMEKKLRESENKFRSVIVHSSDGIVLADGQGNLIEWNPAAEQISGLKRSDVIGQPLWEIIYRMLSQEQRTPDVHEALKIQWNTVVKNKYDSGLNQLTEIEIETPQGGRRTVQSNGFSFATTQGVQTGAIMRDITERKMAEAALKESEIVFSSFLEHSQVYVFFKDKNIRSLRLSKNYEQLLGMPISDMLGKTMYDLFPSDLAKSMVADDLRILNEGQPVTVVEEFKGRTYETVKFPIIKDGKADILAGITLDITERKRAEEAVTNSEKRFRALIENGRDNISLLAADGTLLWESPSIIHTLGYALNQFVGHNIFELMHPDDKDRTRRLFVRVIQEPGSSQEGMFRLLRGDGIWRWIEATATNLLHEPGVQAIVINYRDITDRRNAEEALRKSESLYRQAIEVAGAVPYHQTYTENGIHVDYDFIGEGIRAITGYGPEEFNESLWDSLTQERYLLEDLAGYSLNDAIQQVRSGKYPIWKCEHRIRARDGKIHWVFEAAVELRDEDGISHGSIGMFQDITERKQAEAELRKLLQAVEQSANAIVITDIEGKIEFANPKFVEVSGYSLSEALGRNPRILSSGEHSPEFYRNLWQTIKAGRVWRGEIRNRRKDGTLYWEDSTITPVYDLAHNLVNFIAVKEDITTRKMLEEAERDQRQLAEALRDTSTALNSTLKLDEVLDRVLDNIGKLVTYDAAMVLVIEGHAVRKIRQRSNMDQGSLNQPTIGDTQANLINIPILQAMRETRQPCLIPDTQADPRWRAVPGMGWIRSFISAPVEIRGQVAGLINIQSAEPGFFTSFHSERLMAFASQAAIAIENAQLFEQAYYLSVTDPLTELSNRRYFFDVAKSEFERTHRYRRTLSVMLVDIDHFKNINDTYGHAVGDLALREIASRIKNSVRTVDIVARYGGEEFIVLMPETGLHEAFQVAERVRRSVADSPIEEAAATVTASLSIGVAELDGESNNVDQLIIYADQALYAAKAAGRNQVARYQNT